MLFAVAVLLLGGCASMSRKWEEMHRVRFKVDLSALDYVQFNRRLVKKGQKPVDVNIELDGSGLLQCRVGRSVRVQNDFWQSPEGGSWQDLRSDRVALSREETSSIYQRLVDAGVFDKVRDKKAQGGRKSLVILAKMGFNKQILATDDAAFIKIFDELFARFPGLRPQ